MTLMHMKIQEATQAHSADIARLVMMAMTDECCLNLAGPHGTLAGFARLMNRLTAATHTQYSYLNTLVAVNDDGTVMGAIVSYDGARLHELRAPFIEWARAELGIDHSRLDDETHPGEWYLDSLAVYPQYRGKGVARALLAAAADRAAAHNLPAALLVDKGNPGAERLYRSVGFAYVEDTEWGGHAMRRLRKDTRHADKA